MPGVRTSYSCDDPLGVGAGPAAVDPAGRGRSAAGSGGRACGSPRAGASSSRPCRERSSGMYADPGLAPGAGRPAASCPCRPAARCRPPAAHAHDRLDELGLAVALDPGDPEDLARVDGERHVVEQPARRRAPARRPSHRELATSVTVDSLWSPATAARCRPSARPAAGGDLGGSTVATVVPRRITVISSATCEHLVELVRDEDDRQALGLQLAQVRRSSSSTSCGTSTAVGSSRMSDAGAAVEHLEDLHPLALADAEVLDAGVRVDLEAVRPRRAR